jgi:hypothetical protein
MYGLSLHQAYYLRDELPDEACEPPPPPELKLPPELLELNPPELPELTEL